jgi:hypothetical protein
MITVALSKQLRTYIGFFVTKGSFREFIPVSLVSYSLVCLLLAAGFGLFLFFQTEGNAIEEPLFLVLSATVVLAQSAVLAKTLDSHFDRHRVCHLRYYRLSKRDITTLACLFLAVPNIITGALVFAAASVFGLGHLAILLGGLTFLLCEALPVLFERGKQRLRGESSSFRASRLPLKRSNARAFKSRQTAYLLKDLKTMRLVTVLFELPFCFLLSQAIFVVCALGLLPSFCLYFSYLVLLFEVETAAFEAEYTKTARFHLRRFRVTDSALIWMKTRRLIYLAVVLGALHALALLTISVHPPEMIAADILCLGLSLLVVQLLAWVFVWCLKRRIRLSSLTELLLFLLATIAPLGLLLGIAIRGRMRKKGRADARIG